MEEVEIIWEKKLNVGIDEIDDQHKYLVYYINQLYKITKDEEIKDTVIGVLQGLMDYTVYHFETEDKYFSLFPSKNIEHHKIAHDKFCIDVRNYVEEYKSGKVDVNSLFEYLKKWLINHILNVDTKYFAEYQEFIKAN